MLRRRRSSNSRRGARGIACYIPTNINSNDRRANAIGVRARILPYPTYTHTYTVASNAAVAHVAAACGDGEGFGGCGVGFLLVEEFAQTTHARAGEDAEDVALVLVEFWRGFAAESQEFVAQEGLDTRQGEVG